MNKHRVSTAVVVAVLALSAGGGDDDGETTATATATAETSLSSLASAEQTDAEAYYAELSALSSAERRERLLADAQAAGTFVLYTGDSFGEPLALAFEEQLGIDTDFYRGSTEEALARTLQEAESGQLQADVLISDTAGMNTYADEGLLSRYDSDLLAGITEDAIHEDWIASHLYLLLPAWNTDLVDSDELPDDIAGFADESWSGRLASEIADYDWYYTLYQHYLTEGSSESEVQALFDALLGGAEPVQGHTGSTELLAAGQHDVVLTTISVIDDRFISDGAPISYQRSDGTAVGPVVSKQVGFGLSRTAGNPAAALLFADWLLTDGLGTLRELGIATTSSTDSGIPEGFEVIGVPEDDLAADRARWQDEYAAYFQ